jgi:hypothetical protein
VAQFHFPSTDQSELYYEKFLHRGNYTVKKGASVFEPQINDPQNPKFVDGLTNVPNQGPETKGYVPREDVVLSWSTFTDAAKEAGFSRLVGGIHIVAGNDEGLKLGEMVGEAVWKRYRGLVDKPKSTNRKKGNIMIGNGGVRKLYEKNNIAEDTRKANQNGVRSARTL